MLLSVLADQREVVDHLRSALADRTGEGEGGESVLADKREVVDHLRSALADGTGEGESRALADAVPVTGLTAGVPQVREEAARSSSILGDLST